MVQFICHNCDATLKKNQVDRHTFCKPAAFICLTCSNTFYGMEYKTHTSCLTEKQKYWGQYAEKKKPEQIMKYYKKEELKPTNSWKGWKNEIKAVLKNHHHPMDYESLRYQVLNRYSKEFGEEAEPGIFEYKLKKLKKISIKTMVSLNS